MILHSIGFVEGTWRWRKKKKKPPLEFQGGLERKSQARRLFEGVFLDDVGALNFTVDVDGSEKAVVRVFLVAVEVSSSADQVTCRTTSSACGVCVLEVVCFVETELEAGPESAGPTVTVFGVERLTC